MKCALCGYVFDEEKGKASCSGCPVMKNCRLIRCPNCGYEWPPEDNWIRNLFKRRRKKNATDR